MGASWPTPTPPQVRQSRLDLGLTQAQAARVVGVSDRAWRMWEAGDREMTPQIWKLWKILTKGREK